jgi:hypothetical protein
VFTNDSTRGLYIHTQIVIVGFVVIFPKSDDETKVGPPFILSKKHNPFVLRSFSTKEIRKGND